LATHKQTNNYNPYNYKDIENLSELASAGKFDEAIAKGTEILKVNPLNPSANRELMYCFRKKGDFKTAEKYQNRIHQIFNAMLYTGNGTCEKPYVTFWVKEEYNFAYYTGFSPTGQYSTDTCGGGMADKLEVYNPNTKEKEIIHFNIMPIFRKTMGK
jgi:tetratricopeptide (TPR) repeat protein